MDRLSDTNEESLVLEKEKEKIPKFIYFVAALSAIGGLLFGYDTGVVSGAMILMRDYFELNSTMQGVVVSCTIISAWLSCLCAGQLSDRYGRKIVIISASVVFAVGSVLMGFAEHVGFLIAGRVVVGIGIGLASMCVPMYIAEVAPREIRGTLVTINSCAITSGQLVAGLVDGAFSRDHLHGWRYMLGLAAVPAVLQFCGFLFMPESPRWLVGRGRLEDARRVLSRIRGSSANVEDELEHIRANCQEVEREQANDSSSVLRKVLSNSSLRMALLVGCSLQMIQQVAGINTVMYYSASIIEMSGVRDKSKVIWLSAATSAMNCVCSFIGLCLVERVGRRRLTLCSLVGVILSLTLLAVGFQISALYSPQVTRHDSAINNTICNALSSCVGCIDNEACGFCFTEFGNGTIDGACLASSVNKDVSLFGGCNSTIAPTHPTWAYDWCPSPYSWVTFLGLLMYLFFFAPGMGSMPWTINSEIYPLWARSTCYSIATSVNWFFNFLVSLTFLDLMHAITRYGAFYLYDGLAVLGLVFLFLLLPETQGVSLEEVEGLFAHPWWKDATTSAEKKTVQYVHIRGINHAYAAEDSDDES